MIYVKFDFKGEIRRGTSEPCDNFFKSNTMMLGSIGLIASLPLSYLKYLDSLPMKKIDRMGTTAKKMESNEKGNGKSC